jgi:hypothetical protein
VQYPEQGGNPEERPDEVENGFGQEPENNPEIPADENYPPEDYAREDLASEDGRRQPYRERIEFRYRRASGGFVQPARGSGRNKPLSAAPWLCDWYGEDLDEAEGHPRESSAFFERFTRHLNRLNGAVEQYPPLMLVVLSLAIPLVVIWHPSPFIRAVERIRSREACWNRHSKRLLWLSTRKTSPSSALIGRRRWTW